MEVTKIANMLMFEADSLHCFLSLADADEQGCTEVAKAFRSCGVEASTELIQALVEANS